MKKPLPVFFIIVALVLADLSVSAFNIPTYSYEEMFAKSDLVVIAKPVTSHDTGERRLDRSVAITGPSGSSHPRVAGVITECDALYVVKGPKLKNFKLHHYRDVSPPSKEPVMNNYPIGIQFDPSKGRRYLMFLVHEASGRFAPFADQTVVENLSVQEINGITSD
jgi:hypothetical protein